MSLLSACHTRPMLCSPKVYARLGGVSPSGGHGCSASPGIDTVDCWHGHQPRGSLKFVKTPHLKRQLVGSAAQLWVRCPWPRPPLTVPTGTQSSRDRVRSAHGSILHPSPWPLSRSLQTCTPQPALCCVAGTKSSPPTVSPLVAESKSAGRQHGSTTRAQRAPPEWLRPSSAPYQMPTRTLARHTLRHTHLQDTIPC